MQYKVWTEISIELSEGLDASMGTTETKDTHKVMPEDTEVVRRFLERVHLYSLCRQDEYQHVAISSSVGTHLLV